MIMHNKNMLDNLVDTMRQGAARVQRRSEEVAQSARLRVEVFQLKRELEGKFAELGRGYHQSAAGKMLSDIQEDIRKLEEEIKARERLIEEIGATSEEEESMKNAGAIVPHDSAKIATEPSKDKAPQDQDGVDLSK